MVETNFDPFVSKKGERKFGRINVVSACVSLFRVVVFNKIFQSTKPDGKIVYRKREIFWELIAAKFRVFKVN